MDEYLALIEKARQAAVAELRALARAEMDATELDTASAAYDAYMQYYERIIAAPIVAACVPPAGMPPLPPLGQSPPSPPARAPAPPPELPYYTRGGYVICRVCNLATPYCKGHPRAPGSVAQDGDCDSTLKERIAECQDSK